MNDIFTNFNSGIIKKIHDFINSPDDLIYISGFKGSGKSEVVNKALNLIDDENILLFRHLCFENSVIDDFLLGFYDTFRYYSVNKKIILNKSLTENFAQKVSFYFKNLDKKSLVVIDNFEIISKSSEILDFLSHLGKYENVKLILVSRILNLDFFQSKGLKTQVIDIPPNTEDVFRQKLNTSLGLCENSDIKELYEASKGYELYLKMTIRYIKTVNITLKEFVSEYKKRGQDFGGFLLAKIVSLVPEIYYSLLQNLSCINHCVKVDFVSTYSLGDVLHLDYLYRKLLISKFSDEIYMKDYLKDYFLNTLTLQDKTNRYKRLIEIYENELTKSPKDRILRLSRESIRKQIEYIKTKIPGINQGAGLKRPNFSYISQVQNLPGVWMMNKNIAQKANKFQPKKTQTNGDNVLSEEEKLLIKNFREQKLKKDVQETNVPQIKNVKNLLDDAVKYEAGYNFAKAIESLIEADKINTDKSITPSILIKLASNNSKINNFEAALKYYEMACDFYKKEDNIKEYFNLRLHMANHYKKLYRFEKAKTYFFEIINTKKEIPSFILAKAYIGAAEIEEMENSFNNALMYYESALDSVKNKNDETNKEILCEIYFKTALLHDDRQNGKKALEYYIKNIETSENPSVNKFLSLAYSNTALILNTMDDSLKALEYFKKAFDTDKKTNNIEGIYFSSRQLSGIYKIKDKQLSLHYLNEALECAQQLDDAFKIALLKIDIGDYYYNTKDNAKALINFLEAKKTLGDGISKENKERIDVRINDMKVKMDTSDFNEIMEKYE